jgi:hypothetical protein
MFGQFLPRQIDNTYRGQTPALWLFAILLLMKTAMSLNSIFNGYSVATTADGIPVDAFTPAGAQAVVSLFAIWGLGHLVISLIGVGVLIRYRSLVPFMFALLLLEHLSRRLIHHFLPIVKTGTPPAVYVNAGFLALMITGLALSLWRRSSPQVHTTSSPNGVLG